MEVKEAVLSFFRSKGRLPGNTEAEQLACRYLDTQLIDSMGIIDMVSDFEDKFSIRFEPVHMQSEEFRTIGGLVRIIERMKTGASA